MPTPQQIKQLRDALVSAFPERSSLEQLLYFELDKNLNQITKDSNLNVVVFELIKIAESEGWLVNLISAARKENPGNSQLEIIASTFNLSSTSSVSRSAPIAQSQQPQKILILAANPIGTSQLRLDEELREIEQGLRAARQREQFEIKSALAVRTRDIHRYILDFQPQIVHFSGHGAGQDGLIFTDDTGQTKLVNGAALARLFKLFADRINCVVLNACYSEVQARAIAQHINYVVGMSQAVGDKAAIEFAVGFYDALWAGESIEFAHELGCTLIQMQGISEQLTPKLLKKSITPPNVSSVNPPSNEVTESRSTTNLPHDLDDDLSSDRNVDYTRLRNLLKAGNWKDADYETYLVMVKVVGRENGDWIRDEELLNFPCTDLRTIDSLWVKYSNACFGFSVQKKIYLEVGGIPDGKYYPEAWKKFGDGVGWRMNGSWIGYDDITFDTLAPRGHLPGFGYIEWSSGDPVGSRVWVALRDFFSRAETCKV